jgi:hypothetical protein
LNDSEKIGQNRSSNPISELKNAGGSGQSVTDPGAIGQIEIAEEEEAERKE